MEVLLSNLTEEQLRGFRPDLIKEIQGMREQTLTEELEALAVAKKELLENKKKLEGELQDLKAINMTLKDRTDSTSAKDQLIATIKKQGFVVESGDEFTAEREQGSNADANDILDSIRKA